MIKRVALILVVLAVFVGLIGGTIGLVVRHRNRNQGDMLLERANVAMQARQLERTEELAGRYIQERPEDWRGHYVLGRARLHGGRFDAAREALEQAHKLAPERVGIRLDLADTWSLPGRRALGTFQDHFMRRRLDHLTMGPAFDLALLSGRGGEAQYTLRVAGEETAEVSAGLWGCIQQLQRGTSMMEQIESDEPADQMAVLQALGRNHQGLGLAYQMLAARLRHEQQVATASRRPFALPLKGGAQRDATAAHLQELIEAVEARRQEHVQTAIASFLAILRMDPSQEYAAEQAVDLAIQAAREAQTPDTPALDEVWGAIEPIPHERRPVAATVNLLLYRAEQQTAGGTLAQRRSMMDVVAGELEQLPARGSNRLHLLSARASIAFSRGQTTEAEKLCDEILAEDPRHIHGKLLKGRILHARGLHRRAAAMLYELCREAPGSADHHYHYARVAADMGNMTAAQSALREAVRLNPRHGLAWQQLVEVLETGGFVAPAFETARQFVDINPTHIQAISSYTRLARRLGQSGAARPILERALEMGGDDPMVLMAVAHGYTELGEQQGRDLMDRIARIPAPGGGGSQALTQRIAIAHALAQTGHVDQAESRLLAELEQDPNVAPVHFALGRLYVNERSDYSRGIAHLREALALNPDHGTYQIELARALYRVGAVDECDLVLEQIPAWFVEANPLRVARAIERGDEEIPLIGQDMHEGLSRATLYLRRGQPQEVIEIIEPLLRDDPENRQARRLLAQAFLQLGRQSAAVDQWKRILQDDPSDGSAYYNVARIRSLTTPHEQIEAELRDLRYAYPYLVDLALARVLLENGQPVPAGGYLDRVLRTEALGREIHRLARIYLSQSLSAQGRYPEAIAELDRLLQDRELPIRNRVLLAKAELFRAMDQPAQAKAILDRFVQRALETRNPLHLDQVAMLYLQMQMVDSALEACAAAESILPDETRPLLVRADILARAGRVNDAVDTYRMAIRMSPSELSSYLALARLLEAANRPMDAIAALRQLGELSGTARTAAMLELAGLFARRGLHAQALQTYGEVEQDHANVTPALLLRMAAASAGLGDRAQAREIIGRISPNAAPWLAAQMLLVDLADDDAQRLEILRQMQQRAPEQLVVQARLMSTQLRLLPPDEVAGAFEAFLRDHGDRGIPLQLGAEATEALLRADALATARNLAVRMSAQTGQEGWALLARALEMDLAPDVRPAIGPDASPSQALLLLSWGAIQGDEGAVRQARELLEAHQARAQRESPDARLPMAVEVLAAAAMGDHDRAEAVAGEMPIVGLRTPEVIADLLAHARTGPEGRREAGQVLRATLLMGQPFARRLATAPVRQALVHRPDAQWAAVMLSSAGDAGDRRFVLEHLQPRDGRTTVLLRAEVLVEEGRFDEAAELYASISAEGIPWVIRAHASALEQARQLPAALERYRMAWEGDQDVVAANNAAYLTSMLHPEDRDRLQQAYDWVQAAGDRVPLAHPLAPYLLDTRGWLSYKLGQPDRALLDLRLAVSRLPDYPQVHYHLGRLESEIGSREAAQWHLSAVLDLVQKRRADGVEVGPDELQAMEQARELLASLGD